MHKGDKKRHRLLNRPICEFPEETNGIFKYCLVISAHFKLNTAYTINGENPFEPLGNNDLLSHHGRHWQPES
jgi:hypothetical protein